jgi:hypothetical protein
LRKRTVLVVLAVLSTAALWAASSASAESLFRAYAAGASGSTPHVDQDHDRYTPLVMDVMKPPHWFRGGNGEYKLVYELKLTNGFNLPVDATELVVKNAANGTPVARLSGAELKAAMTPMVAPGDASTEVAPSGNSVVWLELPFKSRAAIPKEIEHTLTVKVPPGLPVPTEITDTGAKAEVDQQAPALIDPPLEGPGWVAVGSCCDGPHRRALQPVNGHLALGQRFAIDWNGVDAEDRFVVGDPDVNESWTFFGKPVLAVADGTVVQAEDRFPDQIPNHAKPVTLPEADGNNVIIKFGNHRYAGYAHLVPGSVAVKVGEHVKAGQVIGELGNSGSSSGPHLHFQVMSAPSLVDAEGLPFEFRDYTEVGRIPPLSDSLFELLAKGEPVPIDTSTAGPRRDALPLGRDVVDFP